jgi:two-component system, LytTR family, response regulator
MATQTLIAGDQIVHSHYGDSILPEEAKQPHYLGRVALKSRGRDLFLPVSHICWIGAEENYVRICTANESYLLRVTMSAIERRLDPKQFLRVHRSAIVNLRYVKQVWSRTRGECAIHLVNGQNIPLSRGYRARAVDMLNRCAVRREEERSN